MMVGECRFPVDVEYANPQDIKVVQLPINGTTEVLRRLHCHCLVSSSHFDFLFVESLCWLTKPLSFLAHAGSIDKVCFC